MPLPLPSPYYRDPTHPHFNRRANHHDYTRPARYLVTLQKSPETLKFSSITAEAHLTVQLLAPGIAIKKAIEQWPSISRHLHIREYVIMPDHLHLCVEVTQPGKHLGHLIGSLKGLMSRINDTKEIIPLFAPGFNDRISYSKEQWRRQLRYTRDNPLRYLMKRAYPDFLLRRWLLTLPDGSRYVLRGNIFLLKQPGIFRVKTSRRFTKIEAAQASARWLKAMHQGFIPISPFIHPHEKTLRDASIQEGLSYIRVCANGFAEREYPSGAEFELMAQGRILLIGQPHFNPHKQAFSYATAQLLNQQAAAIAEACNTDAPLTLRCLC